ncbi:DNA polymerase III subunit epsilon [Acetobacteraceae bacterium]|nr:DNA polymerase III subunit epsilon [Acetobacteraceae bacterium]
MNRVIVFDTETTGLDPETGDRIIEIAGIELINALPTDRYFRTLINPQREIPEEATKVHGFTDSDVVGKPFFGEIIDDFLSFVGNSKLAAHNASFDFKFLNAELRRIGRPILDYKEKAIDTLAMAKAKFPGQPNSLNILCSRFKIDRSERITHNALLDCKLLGQVYLELIGGRQGGLSLEREGNQPKKQEQVFFKEISKDRTPHFMRPPSEEEMKLHQDFIGDKSSMLWNQ